jgi:hypothetical protein
MDTFINEVSTWMYEITICDVIETRYPHLSYFAVDVINIVSADTQFKKKRCNLRKHVGCWKNSEKKSPWRKAFLSVGESARANKEILLSGKNAPFTLARNAEIAVHYVRLFQENNEHVCAGRYSNTSGCIALRNRTHNHATPTPDLGAERYNRR